MGTKEAVDSEKCYIKKLELIRPTLIAYCRSRILDKHKAEDVVQDVLLILSNQRNKYDEDKKVFMVGL